MSDSSIVMIGLPGSGKTTYLAALWHAVSRQEINTKLKYRGLKKGNYEYLNNIANIWRSGFRQERTLPGAEETIAINLEKSCGTNLVFSAPDYAGELFDTLLKTKRCTPEVLSILKSSSVMLFINSDTIISPRWISEEKDMIGEAEAEAEIEWSVDAIPTQGKIIELLQLLRLPPLDIGPRKISFILSAWDKSYTHNLNPSEYLKETLPMLSQYLDSGHDDWEIKTYGLSAQGGEYIKDDKDKITSQVDALRELEKPSQRIKLVHDNIFSHDLTEPLAWLVND